MTTLISCPVVHGDDREDAMRVFREAIDAYERGDFDEAADKFREANKLKNNWKIFYNIGQAEAAAGRTGIALEALEIYISEGGDAIPKQRQDEVHAEIKRFRNIVGLLDIDSPDGCIVYVDDMERGVTPLPGSIWVSAGKTHTLRVVQDKNELLNLQFRLNSGQQKNISIQEAAADETTAQEQIPIQDAASPPNNKKNKLKIAGLILTITGGAVVVGGAVAGAIAIGKRDDFNSECGNDASAACSNASEKYLNASTTAGVASTILFVTGGAVAATGIVLLVVGKKRESRTVSFQPVLSPDIAGLEFKLRF